jgi:hypothetical protein
MRAAKLLPSIVLVHLNGELMWISGISVRTRSTRWQSLPDHWEILRRQQFELHQFNAELTREWTRLLQQFL